MKSIQNRFICILGISFLFLGSCINGIDPLPDSIKNLTMSLSIPIGKVDVQIDSTYHIGLPNWFLTENVPVWAKYETLYFTDTVPVDLTRVYEKSSQISYLAFKIIIWNEYPAECVANISFADSDDLPLYTFDPISIPKGSTLGITQNGILVRSGFSSTTIPFEGKTQIDKLSTAESLVYHLEIKIKDTETWKFQFFNNYKLTCHVGARVDFVLKD